jgi:putative hydrolase of the HAD superfamily
MVEYILFDVAGTLLHKPTMLDKIQQVLTKAGYQTDRHDLALKHKILSETIHFPDKTDKKFYQFFNGELLFSLGIIPTPTLINAIFEACSYLPWEKFEDTNVLNSLGVPMGIVSNFNTTLPDKLAFFFGDIFTHIFVSEQMGVAKPALAFYEYALHHLNLKPENILYIGDSLKLDIVPAKTLGIKTLLIDRQGFFAVHEDRIDSLYGIKSHLKQSKKPYAGLKPA